MGICGYCGEVNSSMRICSRCLEVQYCCPDHQQKHWQTHKLFCNNTNNSSNEKSLLSIGDQTQNDVGFILDNSVFNSLLFNKETTVASTVKRNELEQSLFPQVTTIMTSTNKDSNKNPKHLSSLCQLNLTQLADDLPQEWLTNVTNYLLRDLNHFGFSVIDNFLGATLADKVINEVFGLHVNGLLVDGQTVSHKYNTHGMVRGDKVVWISGLEDGCDSISKFVSTVNTVVAYANRHEKAGLLKNYHIAYRTRAMVACYPGSGSRYVKHVDNPDGDGRCITAIYYVNKKWTQQDGGVLRIYPKGSERVAQIEPIFDRMLFFWSDRRNPHEVLPSSCMRYAITVWYIDQQERENYQQRYLQPITTTSAATVHSL